MSGIDVRAFAVRDGSSAPQGDRIPARLRRGTSLLVRTMADLYAELEPVLTSKPVLVTGSAYGESETALALITAELTDPSTVSPARFATSVHNTAAGLLGIVTSNVTPSTAIAAGASTFAMALVEAIASVRTFGTEVALLVADQPIPTALDAWRTFSLTGVGLVLAPQGTGPSIARLGDVVHAPGVVTEAAPSAPWYPADFVEALRTRASGLVPLTRDGAGMLAIHLEAGTP